LGSGATIHEINVVRKHLSNVKGGQLAATLAPATVVGVILSDVVGNDLDVIASGPITPDASTFDNALDIVDRYDIDLPKDVHKRLRRGANGEIAETPTEGDRVFERVHPHVVADGNTALDSAASIARERDYEPLILSSRVRGESRESDIVRN
jgi:hydroxypyruvate reductase